MMHLKYAHYLFSCCCYLSFLIYYQVIQLHKELLLMGELQQKSQEKLQSQRIANSARHEHEYIQASLSAEIRGKSVI